MGRLASGGINPDSASIPGGPLGGASRKNGDLLKHQRRSIPRPPAQMAGGRGVHANGSSPSFANHIKRSVMWRMRPISQCARRGDDRPARAAYRATTRARHHRNRKDSVFHQVQQNADVVLTDLPKR
jgi:hypothetical protein